MIAFLLRGDDLGASGTKNAMGRGLWLPDEGRVPHISLVFREMWDTANVDRSVHRTNRNSEEWCSGIPHLAKNERDVGHPAFVREPRHLFFLINERQALHAEFYPVDVPTTEVGHV